jgi:hypothetical protein
MSNSKWIIKTRDFELDYVKFKAKLNHITREEDPLIAEGDIKIPVKKKIIKSKFNVFTYRR